ncbi:MFS transporter [Streptomyces sp. NPDC086787]|uniref:MFS transporter n=1 Tax=Streptomyces sp. NPDC086787 TaxID=3365759 RepID=UPI003810D1F5
MSVQSAADDTAPISFTVRDRTAIAGVGVAMIVVELNWFALNLVLPTVARDFRTASTDLQWLVSGYMLALGSMMIVGGRRADLRGRRRSLVLGLIGFAAASVFCAASQNTLWLVLGRLAQGAAAALVFPVGVALVASQFRDGRQSRAVGYVLGYSAAGTALGPFVGALLTQATSWRGVFLLDVALCMVAVALLLRFTSESRDEAAVRELDSRGAVIIAIGLAAIMLGVDHGADQGWFSPVTVAGVLGGLGLLGVFVEQERHSKHPLIDPTLLRNPPFVVATSAGALSGVVYCVTAVLCALYLQQARDMTPLGAGAVFLALPTAYGVASYASGPLSERCRPEPLMIVGMLFTGGGLMVLSHVVSIGWYAAVLALCGLGTGLVWALTNSATQSYAPAARSGAASGLVLTVIVLLGAVGVSLSATALELVSGSTTHAAADARAIETVLRGTSALAFAGALGLLLVRRRWGRRDETAGRRAAP